MSRGSVAYFYFFGDRFIRFAISFSILSIWYFGLLSIMTQYTHSLPFLKVSKKRPCTLQIHTKQRLHSIKNRSCLDQLNPVLKSRVRLKCSHVKENEVRFESIKYLTVTQTASKSVRPSVRSSVSQSVSPSVSQSVGQSVSQNAGVSVDLFEV